MKDDIEGMRKYKEQKRNCMSITKKLKKLNEIKEVEEDIKVVEDEIKDVDVYKV